MILALFFFTSLAQAQTPSRIHPVDPTRLPDRTPDVGSSRVPMVEVGAGGAAMLGRDEYRVLLEASWSGYTEEGRPDVYHRLFAVSGRIEIDPLQGVRALRIEVVPYRRSDERDPRLMQTWNVLPIRVAREALASLDVGVSVRAFGYQLAIEGRGDEGHTATEVVPFLRAAAQVLGYGFAQVHGRGLQSFELGEARAEAGFEIGPAYGEGWVFRWVIAGGSAEAAYLPEVGGFSSQLQAWSRLDLAFRDASMRDRFRVSLQGALEHWQWGGAGPETLVPRIEFTLGGSF